MKHHLKIFAFILSLSFITAQPTSQNTVAILDLEGRGISQNEAESLTTRLRSKFISIGAYRVVERELMANIIEEQGLQESACTTDECAVEVGNLLGVQYMISGSIGKLGQTYTIDTKMVSVETGATILSKQITYDGEIDALINEMQYMAYLLSEVEPPADFMKNRKSGVIVLDKDKEEIVLDELIIPKSSTVAIIDFDGRGISTLEAQTLTDRFRTTVAGLGAVIVVERAMMLEIIDEQGLQQSGCTTSECAVEVGALLGVEYMVGGSIGKLGDTFTIDSRLISVETGASVQVKEITYQGKVDGLIIEIQVLAYEMFGIQPPKSLINMRTGGLLTAGLIKIKTKMGAALRSTLFPGLGQFYSEKYISGYLWLGSELAVTGLIFASINKFNTLSSEHTELLTLYNNAVQDADIINYKAATQTKYDEMESLKSQSEMLVTAAAGIWIGNIIHAYIVGPRKEDEITYKPKPLSLAYDPEIKGVKMSYSIELDF
jgi:curli biogenesis system outer membrane secretion channel CsgG